MTGSLVTRRAKKYIVRREEYVVDYMLRLIERYPQLSGIQGDIEQAYRLLAASFESGGKLLVAGNGGSSADADHIAGELMQGFVKKRRVTGGFAAKLRSVDADSGAELAATVLQGL
ncbi:SIS domain-containing protein, partial [Treponema endosymbiont of Eucomonympha sp.]|uniref:SIS domain-containing protein n=1 Tax=Treponema endosymbiont of Eucomonympha sp. TaxID=1580831 RepID=UPI001EE74B9D